MIRPKGLDLFCGAGGCSKGYTDAGIDMTGVDLYPQRHYPYRFAQADWNEYLAEHWREFDFIHASPPCQAYSGMRRITLSRFGVAPEHPDLIAAVRDALIRTGKPFVIENVPGAPLHTQLVLCGAAMGLPHLARHRHFESNLLLMSGPPCQHRRNTYTIGIYGDKPDGRRVSYRQHRLVRVARSLNEAAYEMGIDWMDWNEITQAIPPAYTRFIGTQIMWALGLASNTASSRLPEIAGLWDTAENEALSVAPAAADAHR